MWYRPMVGNDHRATCCFYFFLPNPHALTLILRHYVQSSLHLFDRSSMAKQNLSHRANVICDGSPSRIRMVRRISLGMTTRPRSSMRRTMPVAFIYEIPPVKADFTSVVFVRCRRNIHPPHMVLHYTEQPALQKTDPPSGGSVFYRVPHSADTAVQQNFTAARVGRYSGSDCVGNAQSSPSILSMSRWI